MNNDLRSGFEDYLRENEPPFFMSPEPSIARARTRTARHRAATAVLGASLVVVIAATALTIRPGSNGPQALDPAGTAGPTTTATPATQAPPGGVVIPVNDRPTLPALSGTDIAGNPLTTDYAGRVTVINIWASYCAPCRIEAPELVAARNNAAPDTQFIGLNYNDSPRAAQAIQTQYELPWPTLNDPDGKLFAKVQSVLDVRGLPATLIVDEQGRVAAHIAGGVESTDLLRLLNTLESPATGDPRAAAATPRSPRTCAPGTLPLLTQGDLDAAQARTSPSVETALQNRFTDAALAEAVLEPMGSGSLAPVWATVGGNTYTVQANKPGQWYVVEATFDVCYTPDKTD